MNIYRSIDREKVQFDFLYHYNMPCFYDDEILALGGHITKFTIRQDNNLLLYLRQLSQFFFGHPEYRVIHGHYSGFGIFYNTIARHCGISVRVGHSHNTNYENNPVGQLDKVLSWFFTFGLTDRFACSIQAGKTLYRGKSFTFLPNGINAAKFAVLDPARRTTLRHALGVQKNEILYGHIGRFSQQKNHKFLLQMYSTLLQKQPNSRLILLGEGDKLADIQKMAAPLGDRVIFAGIQSNTSDYYHAMDVFLLPSLFEGLPVVLIEAQAAGLPCYVSDNVDTLAAFTSYVRFLPLQQEIWVKALSEATLKRNQDSLAQTVAAGYDIKYSAQKLQDFYLRKHRENPR